jgi:hypothetical protein
MGDKTVPFGSWMLRPMSLAGGGRIDIFPDPWNATMGRAFSVVEDELEALAKQDFDRIGECQVETQLLSSRRVYMPTFVIEYKILGAEYKAFVSGCDAKSGVSGVSHHFWSHELQASSESFLSQARHIGSQVASSRIVKGALAQWTVLFPQVAISVVVNFISTAIGLLLRLAARINVFALVGGSAAYGFRKLVKPWMDNRSASAEWERMRKNEKNTQDLYDMKDDFFDTGSAQRYFARNKKQILEYVSGDNIHNECDYDWYKQWEEWARQQWKAQQEDFERQQQQGPWGQQQNQQQQRQQQQQRTTGQQRTTSQKKQTYNWDSDPNDPYAVLGIHRGASSSEVSQAFRREMLKHHPDTQVGASEETKQRSLERSKIITAAYRKLKKK